MKKLVFSFILLIFISASSGAQNRKAVKKSHSTKKNYRVHKRIKKDSVKAMNDPMTSIWIHGKDSSRQASGNPAIKKQGRKKRP
jgi:hypothetical protein